MFTDGDIAPACAFYSPRTKSLTRLWKRIFSRRQIGIPWTRMLLGRKLWVPPDFCACHYRQSDCKQTFRQWFSLSFQFEEKVAAISIAFLDFVSFFLARCSTFRAATRHYLNYQHKKRFVHETAGLNTTKKISSETARTGCRSAIKFIAEWINFYGHFSVVVENSPWGTEIAC